ncbi:MAG: hypothetical protein GY938_11005 [Ketobacter sp.]|nr:hypothetical protein [Ketobacter sp.]
MDKDERKAFARWLNTTSMSELQTALVRLQALEPQLDEEHAISDLKYLKRKILLEIEARRQVAEAKQR